MINPNDLEQQIAQRSKEIATDSLSMSVGEVSSLYRDNEIEIHPEFQRFFRWTDTQKSKLIESILLGIPIPPIFVAQRGDGKWELVDGLQRISTILELMGELRAEDGRARPPLVLQSTTYLPGLANRSWNGHGETTELPSSAKLKLRRARLDFRIVLSASDPQAKYELFQRLNTGGSLATDQEVRNCLIIMADRRVFEWMKRLSADENFQNCIPLSERQLEEQFDMELLTRFIVLRRADLGQFRSKDDLGSFLTESLLAAIGEGRLPNEDDEREFRAVFQRLNEALGENAFRRYDSGAKRHSGALLVSIFETMAIGLGYGFESSRFCRDPGLLSEFQRRLWDDPEFRRRVGSGVSATQRIPYTVAHGRRELEKVGA